MIPYLLTHLSFLQPLVEKASPRLKTSVFCEAVFSGKTRLAKKLALELDVSKTYKSYTPLSALASSVEKLEERDVAEIAKRLRSLGARWTQRDPAGRNPYLLFIENCTYDGLALLADAGFQFQLYSTREISMLEHLLFYPEASKKIAKNLDFSKLKRTAPNLADLYSGLLKEQK